MNDAKAVFFVYGIPALLLGSLFCLATGAALHDAPTYDEPLHITAGYAILSRGSYWIDTALPPVTRVMEALPLLFLPLSLDTSSPAWVNRRRYDAADRFVFHNTVNAEQIVLCGRFVSILVSMGLGVLLWTWTRDHFDTFAAHAALFFYVFSPPVLAHAHLATTDIGFAFFLVLSLVAAEKACDDHRLSSMALAGACVALCITSKVSGLVLLPVLGVLFLVKKSPDVSWTQTVKTASVFALAAVFTGAAVYRFNHIGAFFDGLRIISRTVGAGRPVFLLGTVRTHGSLLYFLIAIAIKSGLGFLLALAFAWLCQNSQRSFLLLWIYLPCAALFIAASCSNLQAGIRYVLPLYPLLCVPIGGWATSAWRARGWPRVALAASALWVASATALAYPNYISYFNESIGGSSRGIYYLGESNLDWGQELKSLGRYLDDINIRHIYLSYFGSADPLAYGIRYEAVAPVSNVDRLTDAPKALPQLKAEPRQLFAISATNLQGIYYKDPDLFLWLRKRRPLAVFGDSLYVYDLTGDPNAHRQLSNLFLYAGLPALANDERQWASTLTKSP